jgi:hypothetical protein
MRTGYRLVSGDRNAAEPGIVGISADRGAKLLEDRLRQRVSSPVIFGMPLHADSITDGRPGLTGGDTHCLDRAIRSDAFRKQAGSELIDALIVERIDGDFRHAGQTMQPAARGHARKEGFFARAGT